MKVDEFRDKTISQIAAAIKSQVIAGGIQHVVIDNLQFLIGLATMNDDKANALERFNQQDRLVGLLRSIATDYGPHITLVVHPRKTDSDTDLDIQHFGGSARVTQEADTVLVIQRRRDENDRRKFRKFLYILKNRYGQKKVESDVIEMIFQPATYTHTLIDHSLNAAGPSK
ncbi:Twinkle protein, mitochondrial [Toxocara canis]|nr:Twinkle protein, mitochondrial [Toxocara canis]